MKGLLVIYLLSVSMLTGFVTPGVANDDHKTLAIGSKAPEFKLRGVDGKTYTLASFKNAGVLVIIFTCKHFDSRTAVRVTREYFQCSQVVSRDF